MDDFELPDHDGSLQAQLLDLYRSQKLLLSALGTSDPVEIIAMVRSLRAQLDALYAERDTGEGTLPVVSETESS